MKLKTLKDIESQFHTPTDNIIGYELRQEAIKWVKDFKKDSPVNAIWFIKKFFNITEEDLK